MIWLNSHRRIVSLYVRGTLRKKFCPWQRLCSSPSCSNTFEGDRNNVVDWFIHVKTSEFILAIVNSFLDIHCDQWCGSSCEFEGEWMNEFYEEFRAFESWTKKQECSAVKYNVPPPHFLFWDRKLWLQAWNWILHYFICHVIPYYMSWSNFDMSCLIMSQNVRELDKIFSLKYFGGYGTANCGMALHSTANFEYAVY